MNHSSVLVTLIVLCLGCGAVPPEVDGGAEGGGGGRTGGGGGNAGGGGGAVGGGGGGGTGGGAGGGAPDCQAGETRVCCSGRGLQTCTDGEWDPCNATVLEETCNGLDDDCDGTVDDDLVWALPDGGVGSSLACEGTGVGACASSGTYLCDSAGAPVCGAPVIAPVSEVCDGIDNDCDGETDEGLKILCGPDADGDQYATDATTSEQCPDPARAAFGNCPVGFVAPGASLGVDCAPQDPANYRSLPARLDADQDGYCIGPPLAACAGASLPADLRAPGSCNGVDDCDDTSSAVFNLESLANDADDDTYCAGNPVNMCIGATPPTGRRRTLTCAGFSVVNMTFSLDCDDHSAQEYRLGGFRRDDDGDGYCTSAAAQTLCYGTAAPSGWRAPAGCAASADCNDSAASSWRTGLFRDDADGDGFCVGVSQSVCYGNAGPAGKRLVTACNATDDCRDSNPNATATCSSVVNSSTFIKRCGVGYNPSDSFNVSWTCPTGFTSSAAAAQFVENVVDPNAPVATSVLGPFLQFVGVAGPATRSVTALCIGAFADDRWRMRVTCTAD